MPDFGGRAVQGQGAGAECGRPGISRRRWRLPRHLGVLPARGRTRRPEGGGGVSGVWLKRARGAARGPLAWAAGRTAGKPIRSRHRFHRALSGSSLPPKDWSQAATVFPPTRKPPAALAPPPFAFGSGVGARQTPARLRFARRSLARPGVVLQPAIFVF